MTQSRADYLRQWAKDNPERIAKIQRDYYHRSEKRFKIHGITAAEYDRLSDSQGGRCAICHKEVGGRELHIDHEHESGTVRGLLCAPCNTAIGYFKDDPNRCYAAAGYLKAHDAEQTPLERVP